MVMVEEVKRVMVKVWAAMRSLRWRLRRLWSWLVSLRWRDVKRWCWYLLRHLRQVDVSKPLHAAAVGAIIAMIMAPVLSVWATDAHYDLTADQLAVMEKPAPDLESKLKYYSEKQANIFNESGAGATDPESGDTLAAETGGGKDQLYTATMPDDPSQGITVQDNSSQVSVTFTPELGLMGGRAVDNHVIYPLKNQSGVLSFTPKGNGVKEDIELASNPGVVAEDFHYKLDVPAYVQPRLNDDGTIGFYTADPEFFGDISYGDQKDEEAVNKARLNDPKNYLMFEIPAPYVKDAAGLEPSMTSARFSLAGDQLTVHVTGLNFAAYPLSIDPTFVLSSTSDFVTGSVDDNIDLSVANQIGRATLTGGSIPTWNVSSFDTWYEVYGAAEVAYNGFVYLIGGVSVAANGHTITTGNNHDNIQVEYDPINLSTGAITATWSLNTTTLQTGRQGLVAYGFNGYLYAVGGETESAVPIATADSVEYAPINSDGTVGTWHYTTGQLNDARSYAAGAEYQGYLYILGGSNGTLDASQLNNYEYAQITGTGDIASWTLDNTHTFTTARNRFSGAAYGGYVYIAGGLSGVGTTPALNNDVQFAPITSNGSLGSWTATTSFPTARRNFGLAVNNGYMYVYAGTNQAALDAGSGTMLADTEYAVINADGTIGQWQQTLNYNQGSANTREPGGTAFYDNHLYFVAGCNAEGAATGNTCGTPLELTFYSTLDSPGRYDRGISNIETTAPYSNNGMTEAKAGGSAVALNGYLYYLGGCNSGGCDHYDSTVEYATLNANGTLGTFAATTALPAGSGDGAGRMGASVVAYNNKLYVIGGTERTTGGTFPTVSSVTPTTVATASTAHLVSMPATVAAGDLLIVIITLPGGSGNTITTPTGWTLITTNSNGTTTRSGIYAKNAAGTEGGTTVGFTSSSSTVATAQTFRILAGNWNAGTLTSVISVATPVSATTASPAPPSLTPSWGADDTLWITYSAGETYTSVTSYPSGFSGGTMTTTGSSTTGASTATAQLHLNAATESPGTYTMNASNTGLTYTLAVQPPVEAATIYMSTILSDTQNSNGTLGGSWTTESNSLPAARAFGTAVVWHNWIYYIGGLSNSTTVAPTTASVYHAQITSNDPGTWTTTSTQLSHIRWGQSVGVWGNWIYVIGGQSDTAGTYVTAANAIEQLTITNAGDINAESTQDPTGQFLTRLDGGFVHNGEIYTFGGVTSGSTAAVATINYAALNSSTGAVGAWTNTNIGNISGATAGLATARGLTTAVDDGGNFYVMGGCTSVLATTTFRDCTGFVSTTDSVELNLVNNGGTGQTDSFGTATALPTATSDHAVVAYNGFLYQIGGCTAYTSGACSTFSSTIEAAPINPGGALGSWTTTGMTALPTATSFEQAVAYNGNMYVLGGSQSGSVSTTTVWIAPISSTGTIGTWLTSSSGVPQLSTAVSNFGAVIANGYLYVAGGNSAGTLQSVVYSSQINTTTGSLGSWTSTTALPTAMAGFTLISYNGYLYAIGGCSGYTSNACTSGDALPYISYGSTNTSGAVASWNYATDVPESMVSRQAVAANGYMYFIGNENDGTEINYVDVNANGTLGTTMDSQPTMAGAHAHGATSVYNGDIYVIGGCALTSGTCTTGGITTSDEYAGQAAISRVGHYSKLFNTQVNTSPSQLVLNGALSGPGSSVAASFYTQATGASSLGVAQVFNPVIFGNFYNVQALNSSGVNVGIAFNYLIKITLDDSNSGTFPDVSSGSETNVQDITLYYHANPGRRLRHGASFTNTGCNATPAAGCILDTAP